MCTLDIRSEEQWFNDNYCDCLPTQISSTMERLKSWHKLKSSVLTRKGHVASPLDQQYHQPRLTQSTPDLHVQLGYLSDTDSKYFLNEYICCYGLFMQKTLNLNEISAAGSRPADLEPKTRFTELNVYPLWPAAISRCSRSEDGSGLPSLFVKSLPFDPGQPWRNAAPADTLQPGRLPNGLLAQGRTVWTWAGWAGKGSGSGSHQGFAKWWWVMSAVWGGEGIMVDWEYRGSLVHTILIRSYQKTAERCLLDLCRGLHITHVLLRLRGVALIFKGEKMTRIISLNTTLKSTPPKKSKSFRETT